MKKLIIFLMILMSSAIHSQTISGDVTISGNVSIRGSGASGGTDTLGYSTIASAHTLTIGGTTGSNKYGNMYTTSFGGSLDSAYFYGANNYNGEDTISILIYEDSSGTPTDLVAESSDIFVTSGSNAWYQIAISGTLSASTDYWVLIYNKTITSATVKSLYDNNAMTGVVQADPPPVNDPFGSIKAPSNSTEFSVWVRCQQ